MIALNFIIDNTSEEEAKRLLQQLGDLTIAYLNKILPKPILAGTPWVYRRISNVPGEPSIELITRTLEHYLWVGIEAIDNEPHTKWSFDLQCPNHAIAVPSLDHPTFHILKPDQVSSLFHDLAKDISTKISVPVKYTDDHSRRYITFQQGKTIQEEN